MIKKNIKILVITSVITLLPILAGLILWNQLPEQMPTHWNAAGEIDGWSSKPFAVFCLPLILLGAQWLCVIATSADPKKAAHPEKILHMIFWFIPVLSVVMHALTYAAALGKEVKMESVLPVILGLLFTIIGNYLPKCKQNYTIGIKVPWTLDNEENWNRTHRLAGRLWVVCGLIILFTGFFSLTWILLPIALLMVLVPFVYSYMLYRKGV
jgi:uncharacterized membrane protein